MRQLVMPDGVHIEYRLFSGLLDLATAAVLVDHELYSQLSLYVYNPLTDLSKKKSYHGVMIIAGVIKKTIIINSDR